MKGYNDLSLKYRGYKLAMHDQLRQLARHIARQEFRVMPTHNPLRVSSSKDIVELWNSHVCVIIFHIIHLFIVVKIGLPSVTIAYSIKLLHFNSVYMILRAHYMYQYGEFGPRKMRVHRNSPVSVSNVSIYSC